MKTIRRAPETEHRKRGRWHWQRTPRAGKPAGAPALGGRDDRTAPAPRALSNDEIERAVYEKRLRVAAMLSGIVLVMSLAFAGWIFGSHGYFPGVFTMFLYLSFAGFPYWAATIHTEGDRTRERLGGAIDEDG